MLSCRFEEDPGVHPIGIGDTARWIVAKAILIVTRLDIQEAAGSLQLCAGQISGIEAAVHAVDSLFHQGETEVILFCLLYTSPSPRDGLLSRMPSSA